MRPSVSLLRLLSCLRIVSLNRRWPHRSLELEQYFNYMGILATEGNYDSMDAFKSSALLLCPLRLHALWRCNELPAVAFGGASAAGMHPMEIILLLASREGDVNRVKEILNVGPDLNAKDPQGRSVSELAGLNKPEKREEIIDAINRHMRDETV